VDLNVVVDLLLAREPFAEDARALFGAFERRLAEGYLVAHAVLPRGTSLLSGE